MLSVGIDVGNGDAVCGAVVTTKWCRREIPARAVVEIYNRVGVDAADHLADSAIVAQVTDGERLGSGLHCAHGHAR
jgi:hypothetical protein